MYSTDHRLSTIEQHLQFKIKGQNTSVNHYAKNFQSPYPAGPVSQGTRAKELPTEIEAVHRTPEAVGENNDGLFHKNASG